MQTRQLTTSLWVLCVVLTSITTGNVQAQAGLPPEPERVSGSEISIRVSPSARLEGTSDRLATTSSLFGRNLILNGDAESDPAGRPTTGWHGGADDFIMAGNYGDSGYPNLTDPGPAGRGSRFFHGSQQAAEINAWQTVDISAAAGAIDSGRLTYELSGYFGGLGAVNDRARLWLHFNTAAGTQVPGSPTPFIGDVTATTRLNTTGLLQRSARALIPKGTRKIDVQLQMVGTGNPNALADNLSLVIVPLQTMIPLVNRPGAPLNTPPNAPTNLTAVADSLTSLKLTWKDNASNEEGFLLERAPYGSSSFAILAYILANTTTYTDSGLSTNSTYTYRLSSYNPAGNSAKITANGSTPANPVTPPAAPASCWTSGTSSTSTVLSWTDSSTNEQYFELKMLLYPGDFQHLANVEPNATSVTIVDLVPGMTVKFRVIAHNAAGDSAPCDTPNLKLPSAGVTGIKVINHTSYPIAYLAVDGLQQFPVYPMGIGVNGYYEMDLTPGIHNYEIRTGFWQDRNNRFDMYTYSGSFNASSGSVAELEVLDVTLAGILTQFSSSGYGYWEGYYFDAVSNCHTAAFQFKADNTYKFYVGNVYQGQGSYSLTQRLPDTFSLKFNAGGQEGLLVETHGEFYMKNGPANWNQITYNYKPQGYVYNSFCP